MAKCIRPKKIEGEVISPKHYTKKELKTKEVLHEILAEYDRLLTRYNNNPTASNKRDLQKYAYHLENPSRLTKFFLDYTQNNEISDASEGDRQLRRFIKEELELGELIKSDDGLIRNPGIISSDNVSTTGNTVTIIIPPNHVENLLKKLNAALVNESAFVTTPCRNMILVIETGSYSAEINDSLYTTVCDVTMDYILDKGLKPRDKSSTIKIVAS